MKSFKCLLKVILFIFLISDICWGSGIESNVPKGFSGKYFFGLLNGYKSNLIKVADLSNNSEFSTIFSSWLTIEKINNYSPEMSKKVMENLDAATKIAWDRIVNSKNLTDEILNIIKSTAADGREVDIVFDKDGGTGGAYVTLTNPLFGPGIFGTGEARKTILLGDQYLAVLLKAIIKNLLDGTKIEFDEKFIDALMHEMLHAFFGLGGNNVNECIIHCLNYKINPKHHPTENGGWMTDNPGGQIPLECNNLLENNSIRKQWEKVTGKGNCFCGVDWTPDGKDDCNQGGGGGGGARRIDDPDDNYSCADANNDALSSGGLDSILGLSGSLGDISGEYICSYFPDIMIYNKYEPEAMKTLLNRSEAENFVDDYEHIDFSNNHKVLVVPSGELMGEKDSELIKEAFKRFVETGGVLLVFGQQDGGDFDNLVPIPDGQSLHSYGWRQDQSCFNGSLYFKTMHPALSSLYNERVSAGVDGYFSVYPNNATVLLRRITNQEPALLYYPYGNGKVILTSLFSDWGLAHSQTSLEELRLIRDLITFAKNPNLDIPMFNLAENASPAIVLNVKIKNSSDLSAVKAKIKVLTPDRSTVLYEIEQNITLNSGADSEIHIEFNLAVITSKDYGICHADYELYDAEGNVIQLFGEADSGRFAIHWLQEKYTPYQGLFAWLTVQQEDLYFNQNLELDVHFRNTSDQTRTIAVPEPFLCVNHNDDKVYISPISMEIPPGEDRIYHASIPMMKFVVCYWSGNVSLRLQYYDAKNVLCHFGPVKVVFLKRPSTTSLLAFSDAVPGTMIIHLPFMSGIAINYSITTRSDNGAASGLTKIRLVVDHFVGLGDSGPHYKEVETVYETEYNFVSGNAFQYSGQFTPTQEYYALGQYRLRLTVATADNSLETNIKYFYYVKSNVSLALDTIPEAFKINSINKRYGLIPGQTYSVNFKLKNSSNFKISQGRYVVTLKSALGTEVFRKEATGIALSESQELTFGEPFVFSPVEDGVYFLQVEYSDETRTAELVTKFPTMKYEYLLDLQMSSDQAIYRYLDTANIQLKIAAVGPLHIKFTDVVTGAVQERDINIPIEQNNTTEIFQVPVTSFSNFHKLSAVVTDSFGKSKKIDTGFRSSALIFTHMVRTNTLGIEEGKPLNLTLAFSEQSGMPVPFPAVLEVQSPSLNYSDSKTVTIQPVVANEFNYQIPIAATVADGFHEITYQLKVDGRVIAQGSASITMPATALSFSEPPLSVNAGAAFDLQIENSGGRPGTFAVRFLVSDENKKQVLEQEETLTLTAGEKKTVTLNMPEGLKSGKYILAQEARHDISGKVFNSTSGFAVSGIESTLNSYTLKDKYFDNEIVAGKAEIVAGGNIANGKLKAKIVKISKGGINVIKPGEYLQYAQTSVGGGCSYGDKTYFYTGMGLVEFDHTSGKYTNLLREWNIESIYITQDGELWLTTWYEGVWRRNTSGDWTKFTTENSLLENIVNDIIERDKDGQKSIWFATEAGISVLSDNTWSSYTTADGLTYNGIYKFAKDNDGEIWVNSSHSDIDRFNGSRFEKVNAPFGSHGLFMGYSSNGDIWFSIDYQKPDFNWSCFLWRFIQGEWNSWDVDSISPNTWLCDFGEDDGEIWFFGQDNEYNRILLKYNSTFTVFNGKNIPLINTINSSSYFPAPIIPYPNHEGLYFGSELGFVEFSSGQWQKRIFEIDKDKLPGPVTQLAGDKQGNIWTAAEGWVSRFDGSNFTHYLSLQGEQIQWNNIRALAAGADSTAYALVSLNLEAGRVNSKIYAEGNRANAEIYEGNSFILKIAENNISRIPCPEDFVDNSSSVLAVDNSGRLWMSINKFYEELPDHVHYYDGVWHDFAIGLDNNIRKIISDGNGGVWIAGNKLIHIISDLSSREYPAENSQFDFSEVSDLYLDSTGVLWIFCKQTSEEYREAVQTLQNDIFTLKAISSPEQTTPGYPAQGIYAISEQGAGNVVFVGTDETDVTSGNNIYHLFKLTQDGFTADNAAFYLRDCSGYYDHLEFINAGGLIYTTGYIQAESSECHLLQIGAGMGEETVWSNEYPVDVNGGASVNIDLLPGKALAAGNYILESELVSAIDQKLAASQYGFLVRGSAVAASIVKSGSSDPNVRAGINQEIKFEVLNNTAEDKTDLTLKVKKLSPSGVETILQEGPLSLNAGQSNNGTLTFNESESGVWQLTVEVREAGTLLDNAELILRNSEPAVTYEIIYPEYAGDEPFPVKIKLANQGQIATAVHVLVGAISSTNHLPFQADKIGLSPEGKSPLLDEDVTLKPSEERILSFTDTISADRIYDIALSGDLVTNEQKTVKYGYVENLALNVLPQYREGGITMGYSIANSGGMPFSATLHFKLYVLGTEAAIYTADKNYNLYPGADASADNLELSLVPGAYQLRWTTGKGGAGQADFSVLPSGIGQLLFAPAAKYPIGLTDMAYQLSNSDTVAGNIPLLIEIIPAAGGAAIYSETRNYYINVGESVGDAFSFDFVISGAYIIRLSGSKIVDGGFSAPFKVLNLNELTSSVAVQPVVDGVVPVLLNIVNTGYSDFAGTLVIEAGGLRHEEPLQVISEATLNQTYNFDANGLAGGSQEVKAYLYDAAGNIIAQNTQTVMIKNAVIKVVEVPQNLAIAAGSFANVTLKVKNEGNRRGEAKIVMNAFDTLNETRELVLEAGEEKELTDIFIDVDGDIPAGRYPFNYTLSGTGVANGLAKGNFTFQVNGIALDVTAALDRSLYNEGETAQLTINVSSANPVLTPLEAVVNWNDFNERRTFTQEGGGSSLTFDIPLAQASSAKVFYGIYQEGGRGIYLNDIYLNFAGSVSVILDQQVYAPGASIHALFTVGEPGSLTAECFGTSQTVAIGSSVAIDFAVPANALGGSYGVAWTFTPGNIEHAASNGAKPFDVSGLVVKVAKAELERGKYAPNDTIKAMLTLESNQDISLNLRSWTTTPEGQWTYLGEQSITLAAANQTPALLEYAFNTTEAGTHRFVYGLYREEQLVVSGAAAFDCGDAVLLGLACDHLDYPDGNETVKVKADYFGMGAASLKLFLDDVQVDERSITLAGLGSNTIDLTSAQISGGRHDLRAVMSKDGLTSSKETWFGYGSNLPDLAVEAADRSVDGLNYTYTIRVGNNGKTSAVASTLIFADNDVDKQTAAVAALTPAAWQEFQFNWSGSGHAGSHTLSFTVDRENAIKEYVEANNILTMVEEVPALFYKLAVDPQIWPANSNVSIFSRLINNTETNLALQLHLTLTHNASSLSVFARDKAITLSPYTTTLETDIFNTGTYPVGDYTLRQTASGAAVELTEELTVIIEASKVISGTMTVTPTTVAAGAESQVSLHLTLRNNGNVALENEPLTITVTNKESQEVIKSEPMTVTLALGENKTIERDLALTLAAGVYTISLEHLENVVAQAELLAANSLDKDKYVSNRPRLLFMNLLAFQYRQQKDFIKAILNVANVSYQDTANIIETYLHYQKGENNINVVFGKLPAPNLQKEIRERVFRGEGLIYIVDNPANGGIMDELGGIRAGNLSMPQREKEITVAAGILGNGGTMVLKNKCKLALQVQAEDVQVIAATMNGKKPMVTYREYGRGKVLTICVPLEFASGSDVFAQLLLNAVNLFNLDVFSPSDLARVMPMELRIKNNTSADKIFRVQELIPQKATGYGYNPPLLAGAEIKWDVNLKVNEEKVISYWLQLPDAIGTFDIKSEIYDGEQKMDEALLTFEVVQKVVDRVVEIMAEINASGDAQAKKALLPLNRIKNRNGDDTLTLLLNLDDAIQAADLVGKSGLEVTALWRQQLQNVMMVYARKLYDKMKNLALFELNSFGKRFQE